MYYAVTHGHRSDGYDPKHTPEGLNQVACLCDKLPPDITAIALGTGHRFHEMFDVLRSRLNAVPPENVRYSPLVGSGVALDVSGDICYGRALDVQLMCRPYQYVGIADTKAFDAWKFVSEQRKGTLFLTGGEFLIALGVENPKRGALYRIDGATRLVILEHQG